MKQLQIPIFMIVMVLYLWLPYQLSQKPKRIAENGKIFRLELQNFNRYNLSGSYANLDFVIPGPIPTDKTFYNYQRAYATLQIDSLGFARVQSIHTQKPENADFIQVRINYVDEKGVYISLPESIQYYYLKQPLSSEQAEKIRSQRPERELFEAYATVRIWEGDAMIEHLFIEGLPVEQFIQQHHN